MSRPKERIKKILAEYQISGKVLTALLGLRSSSSLSNIISGDPDELNLSITQRILEALPDLEPEWVKSGQGAMFKEGVNIRQLVGRNVIERGNHNIQGSYNVQNMFIQQGTKKLLSRTVR